MKCPFESLSVEEKEHIVSALNAVNTVGGGSFTNTLLHQLQDSPDLAGYTDSDDYLNLSGHLINRVIENESSATTDFKIQNDPEYMK